MAILPLRKRKKEIGLNEEKRAGLFGRCSLKIKLYFYNMICNDIKRITLKLYKKEKYFCKHNKEFIEIQESISKRKEDAAKFEQVKQVAPLIQSGLNEVTVLQKKLEFCSDLIDELYVAYKQDDRLKVEEIFDTFKEIGILKNKIEGDVKW